MFTVVSCLVICAILFFLYWLGNAKHHESCGCCVCGRYPANIVYEGRRYCVDHAKGLCDCEESCEDCSCRDPRPHPWVGPEKDKDNG